MRNQFYLKKLLPGLFNNWTAPRLRIPRGKNTNRNFSDGYLRDRLVSRLDIFLMQTSPTGNFPNLDHTFHQPYVEYSAVPALIFINPKSYDITNNSSHVPKLGRYYFFHLQSFSTMYEIWFASGINDTFLQELCTNQNLTKKRQEKNVKLHYGQEISGRANIWSGIHPKGK